METDFILSTTYAELMTYSWMTITKPYESWILNTNTFLWEPPIPPPENNPEYHNWNEDTQTWINIYE